MTILIALAIFAAGAIVGMFWNEWLNRPIIDELRHDLHETQARNAEYFEMLEARAHKKTP